MPGKGAIQAAAKYAEFVAQGKGLQLWNEHLKQQIYLGDDAFIVRMQKLAGLDDHKAESQVRGHKANVSKIHTRAPPRDSDVKRYVDLKFTTKKERNQNMADAFYQGGHSQTAIALGTLCITPCGL